MAAVLKIWGVRVVMWWSESALPSSVGFTDQPYGCEPDTPPPPPPPSFCHV